MTEKEAWKKLDTAKLGTGILLLALFLLPNAIKTHDFNRCVDEARDFDRIYTHAAAVRYCNGG